MMGALGQEIRRRRGVTLLELLLVVSLVAATGVLAVGSMSVADRSNRTRLAEAASRELDELSRTWARTVGACRLASGADHKELLLLSQSGERLASRAMPSGISARIVCTTDSSITSWVWFDATGAAPDYRIVFGDEAERRWAMRVAGLTGLMKVEELDS